MLLHQHCLAEPLLFLFRAAHRKSVDHVEVRLKQVLGDKLLRANVRQSSQPRIAWSSHSTLAVFVSQSFVYSFMTQFVVIRSLSDNHISQSSDLPDGCLIFALEHHGDFVSYVFSFWLMYLAQSFAYFFPFSLLTWLGT